MEKRKTNEDTFLAEKNTAETIKTCAVSICVGVYDLCRNEWNRSFWRFT